MHLVTSCVWISQLAYGEGALLTLDWSAPDYLAADSASFRCSVPDVLSGAIGIFFSACSADLYLGMFIVLSVMVAGSIVTNDSIFLSAS